MDPIHNLDVPKSLSVLPGYPRVVVGHTLWVIVILQLAACIAVSIFLSSYVFKNFYTERTKSWKNVVGIMGPIRKRLHNLERETAIWNSYLEWTKDYYDLYCSLLNYLNSSVMDLDDVYDSKMCLKNFSESAIFNALKEKDPNFKQEVLSEETVPDAINSFKVALEDDTQFMSKIATICQNLELSNDIFEKDFGSPQQTISASTISKVKTPEL